jgi:hypothetical protein
MLARDLKKTHAQLLAGTSAQEIATWRVLYEVEYEEAQIERAKHK